MPGPPLSQLLTCISYEEFSGDQATLEGLRQFLSGFRREQVVFTACFVNAFLETWGGNINYDAHADLVKEAFFSNDAEKLLNVCNSAQRFVFHRQQVLLVAKDVIINCSDEGIDPLATKHWGGLGRAFLMASSLDNLRPPAQTASEEILRVIANTISNTEYSGRYVVGNCVSRASLILTRLLPLSSPAERPPACFGRRPPRMESSSLVR